ncbi:MAG TPA: hydrogenase nickel incorporation protein HypA [Lentisphaeria bacterium]|nr:MAG: hypothetical protein A2X48_20135 [Lentisphaerae bacterium GWF2_49_21]HBC86222.1 hydrogenase nickel incorporation protein HypA [Lentisphaeria bacterium]
MHELALATSLVEQITAVMKYERASKLHSVRISIGRFSGVEKVALKFAFPMAAERTPAAGAKLIVEITDMKLKCRACGKETIAEIPLAKCGKCDSLDVEVVCGRELIIKSMEIE